jgi:hypothetical protein
MATESPSRRLVRSYAQGMEARGEVLPGTTAAVVDRFADKGVRAIAEHLAGDAAEAHMKAEGQLNTRLDMDQAVQKLAQQLGEMIPNDATLRGEVEIPYNSTRFSPPAPAATVASGEGAPAEPPRVVPRGWGI